MIGGISNSYSSIPYSGSMRMAGKVQDAGERMAGKVQDAGERMAGKVQNAEERMAGKVQDAGDHKVKGGYKSSPAECQTCRERKYKDGSNEADVSFKSPGHISPRASASTVMAHEQQHVANAYQDAAEKDGKVISCNVSLHTSVCPECGTVYVSGGTTSTSVSYPDESNPYQKDKKAQDAIRLVGANIDYVA